MTHKYESMTRLVDHEEKDGTKMVVGWDVENKVFRQYQEKDRPVIPEGKVLTLIPETGELEYQDRDPDAEDTGRVFDLGSGFWMDGLDKF